MYAHSTRDSKPENSVFYRTGVSGSGPNEFCGYATPRGGAYGAKTTNITAGAAVGGGYGGKTTNVSSWYTPKEKKSYGDKTRKDDHTLHNINAGSKENSYSNGTNRMRNNRYSIARPAAAGRGGASKTFPSASSTARSAGCRSAAAADTCMRTKCGFDNVGDCYISKLGFLDSSFKAAVQRAPQTARMWRSSIKADIMQRTFTGGGHGDSPKREAVYVRPRPQTASRRDGNNMSMSVVLADHAYMSYGERTRDPCSPRREGLRMMEMGEPQQQEQQKEEESAPPKAYLNLGKHEFVADALDNNGDDDGDGDGGTSARKLYTPPASYHEQRRNLLRPEVLYLEAHSLLSVREIPRIMMGLRVVNLSRSQITSVEGLGFLPFLESLDISFTRVSDISPLGPLDKLTKTSLGHPLLKNLNAAFCLRLKQGLKILFPLSRIVLLGCFQITDAEVDYLCENSLAVIIPPRISKKSTLLDKWWADRMHSLTRSTLMRLCLRSEYEEEMCLGDLAKTMLSHKKKIQNRFNQLRMYVQHLAQDMRDSQLLLEVSSLKVILGFVDALSRTEPAAKELFDIVKHVVRNVEDVVRPVVREITQEEFLTRIQACGISEDEANAFMPLLLPTESSHNNINRHTFTTTSTTLSEQQPNDRTKDDKNAQSLLNDEHTEKKKETENEKEVMNSGQLTEDILNEDDKKKPYTRMHDQMVSEDHVQKMLELKICQWEDFENLALVLTEKFGSPENVASAPMDKDSFIALLSQLPVTNLLGLFQAMQKDNVIPVNAWSSLRFSQNARRLNLLASFRDHCASKGKTMEQACKEMDENKSGAISFSEFERALKDYENAKWLKEAKNIWSLLDLDRSNILRTKEVAVWEHFQPDEFLALIDEFQRELIRKFKNMERAYEGITESVTANKMTKAHLDKFLKLMDPKYYIKADLIFAFLDSDASGGIALHEWLSLSSFPLSLCKVHKTYSALRKAKITCRMLFRPSDGNCATDTSSQEEEQINEERRNADVSEFLELWPMEKS